jgi:hypothetical protein
MVAEVKKLLAKCCRPRNFVPRSRPALVLMTRVGRLFSFTISADHDSARRTGYKKPRVQHFDRHILVKFLIPSRENDPHPSPARTREEYRILSDGTKEPTERMRRRRRPAK